ncbi:MAG TPA: hypothetical protein DCY27_15015, partial [Desulfobacterales bacterium]|nr:hypothetical protein [Desulfobacterales bacterium]
LWRLPDTGQAVSYTATFGEDNDYNPPSVQKNYTTFYGGVETSSVTVDNVTGLVWVSNPSDVSGGLYVSSGTWMWLNALTRCENLSYAGYDDWRLPNVNELLSIADFGRQNPAIDTAYFLNTENNSYWTSTPAAIILGSRFYVTFISGGTNIAGPNTLKYVRCVRGGL